jgi:hypothetical protein
MVQNRSLLDNKLCLSLRVCLSGILYAFKSNTLLLHVPVLLHLVITHTRKMCYLEYYVTTSLAVRSFGAFHLSPHAAPPRLRPSKSAQHKPRWRFLDLLGCIARVLQLYIILTQQCYMMSFTCNRRSTQIQRCSWIHRTKTKEAH